jgi:dihydroneopterin aldolase
MPPALIGAAVPAGRLPIVRIVKPDRASPHSQPTPVIPINAKIPGTFQIMNDQLSMNCRRLFLRGLTVQAHIGIHAHELQAAQRIVIDVDLYVPFEGTRPRNDRIDEVVDYDFVRTVVYGRVAQGHINLQETLCDAIAQALLGNTQISAVRVSTCKPDVYPDCDAVGVEVFRLRAAALAAAAV